MNIINDEIVDDKPLKPKRNRTKKYENGAVAFYQKNEYHKIYYKTHVKNVECPCCKMNVLNSSLKPHQKTKKCNTLKNIILSYTQENKENKDLQ